MNSDFSDSVGGNSQINLGYEFPNLKMFEIPKIKQESYDKEVEEVEEVEEEQECIEDIWSAKVMKGFEQSRSSKKYRCSYSNCGFTCLKNEDCKKHLIVCHQYDQGTKGSSSQSTLKRSLKASPTYTNIPYQGSTPQVPLSQPSISQLYKFKSHHYSTINSKEKILHIRARTKGRYYPMTKKKYKRVKKKIKQDNPDNFKHECNASGCSFKCRSKWDLKNHQISAHYHGKKFYCHIGGCKSVFKEKKNLIIHINKTKHHVDESPIKVAQKNQKHPIGTISAGQKQIPVMKGHKVSQYSKYPIVTLSYLVNRSVSTSSGSAAKF